MALVPHYGNYADAAGNAISGATVTVTVYSSGAEATLYSDAEGTAPILGNVVLTNDLGTYEFYAASGRYLVTITASGYDTVTRDEVLPGQGNIEDFGASRTADAADNRAALQAAIAAKDAEGGGTVVVPSGVDYGYVGNDKTTYPDLSGLTNDVTVEDGGIGDADGAGNKAGAQLRIFFGTAQTTPFGMHDGNGHIVAGDWHPYCALNNTATIAAVGHPSRLATDNRRLSYLFENDGRVTWRIGQGALYGAGYSNEELSNFCIQHFQTTGDTLADYSPLIIARDTGNWAVNTDTNASQYGFHLKSKTAGYSQACYESLNTACEVVLRTRNPDDSSDDVSLRNEDGNLSLRIVGVGDALTVSKDDRSVTVQQALVRTRVFVTYSASMTANANLGNQFTVTVTNATAWAIAPSGGFDGQQITVTVRNDSGGAMGTGTWTGFKMAAWTAPADGFSRSVIFENDGAVWCEVSRTPADVPN